jgi:GxxExxY protein
MDKHLMSENELSNVVIGYAIEVHSLLGPGLLESAYKECLFYELTKDGLFVEREKAMPIVYKDMTLNQGYRIDLLVEKKLVVEIKTIEEFTDVHTAQVLTYLRLGSYRLGLLINFHVRRVKDGIKRIIN